ncbi:unnamed protein product [Amoebophrya sp. A25]|nr:unnamed protein product [Amoebophrya sp. A25]|eukprot:GSA25T00015020001.1
MKSKSARIMVEPIPAPAPSSLRYRGAGGPSQYLSSLQQSEEYEEALEKELEKDQLLEVYYEGGGCCNGRLKIRRIGGCRCLSYNVVLWLLLIMVLCCVEFLYWKYFVYDPRYKVDTETRVVIISSAGGSGHLVAEKEIIKKMKSAAGWVPFAKATPGQLERLRNMPDKSFQSLYVVPKACETYDPKHKVWMPEGCYKRSWIQINDLISGVLEMMFDKVLTDFGRQGTEQWDEAQKTGDYDFLFQAIQLKDTVAEMLFSWGFRENTKAYLKTHPNVEFVVSVQAQLTNNIYQGVEIINRKREKQAYKKYLKTGNPADKKFSGVHFCLSLTDPPSQNNFFIRGLKQIQAHSGPRDKEHFIHIDMPHAGQAFMGLGHPQYPQNLLSSPQVQAGGQVAANAVMKDKALIDKAMAEAENEEYQFIDRRTPANVAYYKGMFNNRMIKTFRFTDGPIRTEFQKAVDDYYYKYPDGVPSRNAALVLPNIKNVNMNKEAQRIDIGADEHVAAVMLGGQAAVAATKHYVMGEAMRWVSVDANGNFDTTKSCQKVTIFAFCVKNEKLINEVMEISKTLGDQAKDGHRSRIRIFALGLQDSDVIAPIFQRAQNVYIRSGGMQIFEARSLVMGSKVTIHSDRPLIVTEKTRDGHPYKFCTRGMLSHEMGNAAWLLESLGQAMLICTYDGNDRQCFEVQPSGERLEYEKFVQTEADSAFYDPVEKKYKWASCIYVPGKHLAAKNMKAHKPEVTRCPP